MSVGSRAWTMLDTAARIHRLDCESLSAPLPAAVTAAPDGVSDEAISYGLVARQIYSDLKRIVGQTAGLLILAQTSGKREAFDLASLEQAECLWRETEDRLRSLSASARQEPHRARLVSTQRLLGTCLAALCDPRLRDGTPDLAVPLANLSAAYKHLQAASADRFGMTMVDFRHSCCNCRG